MVLFRCPVDRRQIGNVADRTFDKNNPAFMEIYNNITSKPYPYVIVDNKADTPSRRQVMTEVFGNCVSYNIRRVDSAVSITKQVTKAIDLKADSVKCYKTDHSKILKRNYQKGHIIGHLDKLEWSTVHDEFQEAECGGNQCLLKSWTQKTLNVIKLMMNGCLPFVQNIALFCKMMVSEYVLEETQSTKSSAPTLLKTKTTQ